MAPRFLGCIATVLVLSSSASALDAPARPIELETPAIKKVWSQRLPGFVTDLAVSADAESVFFATIPDFDRNDGQRDFRVSRVNRSGKVLWSKKTEAQVKAVSISDDGKVAVFADYNDELTALGPSGKQLWKVHGPCRPLVMGPLKKVVCYHDDDAEPKTAYELLELGTGKRAGSFPISGDILALKLSSDARGLVMALHDANAAKGKQNRIVVMGGVMGGAQLGQLGEAYVGGVIVDVAVSSGASPNVAVLWNSGEREQKVTLLRGAAPKMEMTASEVSTTLGRGEQIEISSNGEQAFVYGNSVEGQWLRAFSGTPLRLEWSTQMSPKQAEYSSGITVTDKAVVAGVESIGELSRTSSYRAFQSTTGTPLWQTAVTREPGSYLYTQAWAPRRGLLVVGTDDAWLSAYAP